MREILQPWHDRVWFVPGNHEDRAILRATFPDRIAGDGRGARSRSRSPPATSLCIGLDTHVPGQVAGHVGADQIEWVEAQLEAHDPATAVLFMHHPPILLGLAWLDRIGLAGREQLQDLILRDAADPARLLRPRAPRVQPSRRRGDGRDDALDRAPVQPRRPRRPSSCRRLPAIAIIELDGDSCVTRVVRLPEARYAPSPAD